MSQSDDVLIEKQADEIIVQSPETDDILILYQEDTLEIMPPS